MNRRIAALSGLVLAFGALGAGPALAAEYPPGGNQVVAPATPIVPGTPIPFSAQVFLPGSPVSFDISDSLGAIGPIRGASLVVSADSGNCESGSTCVRDADESGVATADITFTEEGSHTITASGTGADGEPLSVSATVDVGGEGAGGPGEDLADTGSDIITYVIVGAALVVVGGLVVVAVRRRNHTPNATA